MSYKKPKTRSRPDPDDHSELESSPLRGNFIPLPDSVRRVRADENHHGLRIQVSLSESEMSKLAAVLSPDDTPTRKPRETNSMTSHRSRNRMVEPEELRELQNRPRSPENSHLFWNAARTRSRSPTKATTRLHNDYIHGNGVNKKEDSKDHGFGSRKPNPTLDNPFQSPSRREANRRSAAFLAEISPSRSIAERRNITDLPYLDTSIARQQTKREILQRLGPCGVVVQVPPPADDTADSVASGPTTCVPAPRSPSIYSDETMASRSALVSPLRLHKSGASILGDYMHWLGSPVTPETATRTVPIMHAQSTRELSVEEQPYTRASVDPVPAHEPVFSPLTPFFQTEAQPGVRKGTKKLLGDDGWLEKTAPEPKKVPIASPPRKNGFFDNLVKKAKVIVDKAADHTSASRRASADPTAVSENSTTDKQRKTRSLAISFSLRQQSLLYCDLEYVLSVALNGFLTSQWRAGRLDTHKLHKTETAWLAKGRPRVSAFHYDLETQLELLRAHASDFEFYGTHGGSSPSGVVGFLDIMKTGARAMRVRTLCQPDTVIAKHIVDAEALFNLLGVPNELHIMLQNVRAFFQYVLRTKAEGEKDKDSEEGSSHRGSTIRTSAQAVQQLVNDRGLEPRVSRYMLGTEGDIESDDWDEMPRPKMEPRKQDSSLVSGRRSPVKDSVYIK